VGANNNGSHGLGLDSSGNRSGWASCDVCVTDGAGNIVRSVNERAWNDGASGAGTFLASVNVGPGAPGHPYYVSKYAGMQAAIDAAYNNGTVQGPGTVIDDRTTPYTGPGFVVRDSVTLRLAATTYTITGTVSNNNGVANVTAGIISMPGSHRTMGRT
jgi:hypothetical protein